MACFEIAGEKRMESKKTKVTVKVSKEERLRHWCAVISDEKDNVLSITVHTPPDCIIGKWNIRLDSRIKKKVLEETEENPEMRINAYKFAQPVYILFNAWCRGVLNILKILNQYIFISNLFHCRPIHK